MDQKYAQHWRKVRELANLRNSIVGVVVSACNGGGYYNKKKCIYDGGDCAEFNKDYPKCEVQYPYYVNDGVCDDDSPGYYTKKCKI